MASRNYIVPVGSMSLMDQKDYRMNAVAAGLLRAGDKKIGTIDDEIPGLAGVVDKERRVAAIKGYLQGGGWPRSLDLREFQPILDAGAALDQWNTAALAAVGAAYSCFQAIAAPTLAANRLAIFYKVGVETVALPVSRLIVRSGGAVGNILAIFDLEQLVNRLETDGYFSEPVVIDPNIIFAVQVLCRIATGVLARVQLGAYIIEPSGQTIA